jgi:hypothetical protein
MARITFSIKNFLQTSLLTEVMDFVSRVPATLLTLFLFVGSLKMNGKTHILPEKVSFHSTLNLGWQLRTLPL